MSAPKRERRQADHPADLQRDQQRKARQEKTEERPVVERQIEEIGREQQNQERGDRDADVRTQSLLGRHTDTSKEKRQDGGGDQRRLSVDQPAGVPVQVRPEVVEA